MADIESLGLCVSGTQRKLDIGPDCGYDSAQSFSRAFKGVPGLPPSQYRRQDYLPIVLIVDEMMMNFTNRLKGGVFESEYH